MNEHSIRNMTRGGQTLLHTLRMINQVLNQVLLWMLPIGILVFILYLIFLTTPSERYITRQWGWAKFNVMVDSQRHPQHFQLANGLILQTTSGEILKVPFVQDTIKKVFHQTKRSFEVGLISYGSCVCLALLWLSRRGNLQSQPKHIKGDYLGSHREAKHILQARKEASSLILGRQKLPLPLGCELQHFLFHGTTGSGKSSGIRELLVQIRARGDRALIYDKSCNFVEEFYDASDDILMNPFDARGVDWSLWKECRDKAEFENLAAAQIPMPLSTQDPFWVNAARTIFAAAAYRLRKEKNPKILPLLRHLLTADIQELQSLLKGTEAETLISEKTEKTAISIKSVLATYLKSLCYIKDGDHPFSIREWMQNDETKSWLFLSSLDSKHESAKPLITAWLDIAINELLSLTKKDTRRIWFILDEVTSLHQLPYLNPGLAEARKFGGCFVLGLLSSAELAHVYGHQRAQAISALLNTRLMFRQPDPEVAQWSAKNLGESTFEEVREGISYGANTMRDGVSLNRVERDKSVVTASEIMRLHNLHCFVRLPGQYPIVPLQFDYKKPVKVNEPFVARSMKTEGLREDVLDLAENLKQNFSRAKDLKKPEELFNPSQNTQIKNDNNTVEKISSIKDRILE